MGLLLPLGYGRSICRTWKGVEVHLYHWRGYNRTVRVALDGLRLRPLRLRPRGGHASAMSDEGSGVRTLVIATNNPGKLREFRELLAGCGFELVTPRDLGVDFEPEETGATFEANARIKAEEAARLTGLLALADDSGLEIDALGGRPGDFFGPIRRSGQDRREHRRGADRWS